jgi:hypothetical protein
LILIFCALVLSVDGNDDDDDDDDGVG